MQKLLDLRGFNEGCCLIAALQQGFLIDMHPYDSWLNDKEKEWYTHIARHLMLTWNPEVENVMHCSLARPGRTQSNFYVQSDGRTDNIVSVGKYVCLYTHAFQVELGIAASDLDSGQDRSIRVRRVLTAGGTRSKTYVGTAAGKEGALVWRPTSQVHAFVC